MVHPKTLTRSMVLKYSLSTLGKCSHIVTISRIRGTTPTEIKKPIKNLLKILFSHAVASQSRQSPQDEVSASDRWSPQSPESPEPRPL